MNIFPLLSLYIYILVVCILFNKKNIYIYILSGVVLILFATFRSNMINIDTNTYINYYKTVPSFKYLFEYNNYYFEKGYVFLNMLVSSIGLNYRFFLFITASLSISLIMTSIYKYTKYCFITLFIYFSNFYFLNELLIMRTGIAFSILFFAIRYLKYDKKKYILLVILGSFFHRISLVALLPILLFKIEFIRKRKLVLISLAVAFILGRGGIIPFIANNLITFLPHKIIIYFENYEPKEASYRQLILFLPIFLYFLKNFYKYKNVRFFEESILFLFLMIISKFIFIKHETLDRISHLFLMGILFLPDIYLKSIKEKEVRFFTKFMIIVFFGLLLIWYLRGDNVITIVW